MKARDIDEARHAIVASGRSLFERGLATGSSGNLSVRLDDQTILITPTNVSLGALEPNTLAHVAPDGQTLSGQQPSKETPLHLAVYAARSSARAVVHLHSTYSAAVSCLDGLDAEACLPPLTAYFVMKVGRLPLIRYFRPGDADLAALIGELARRHPAVLLANHGPLVAGTSLADALNRTEELEETAKLFLLLRGSPSRPLTPAQIAELDRVFGSAIG